MVPIVYADTAIKHQLKGMNTVKIQQLNSVMLEKVKRLVKMVEEDNLSERDKTALIDKISRLKSKYAHVENELLGRNIILKEKITSITIQGVVK